MTTFRGKIGFRAQLTHEVPALSHPSSRFNGKCEIGAYTYFGESCLIGSLKIGRYCSVAPNVVIGLGEHDINTFSTHPFFFCSKNGFDVPDGIGIPRNMQDQKHARPEVGHDVWIGVNAVIRRGIKIGNGAVIAAGAVVTENVPDYAIVGGIPAKLIGYRFDEMTIHSLLISRWWDIDVSFFSGKDISDISVLTSSIIEMRNSGEGADANYDIAQLHG